MWQISKSMIPTIVNVFLAGMDPSVARFAVGPKNIGGVQAIIDKISPEDLNGGILPSISEEGTSFYIANEGAGIVRFGPLVAGERRSIAFAAIEQALGQGRLPEDCFVRAGLVTKGEPRGDATDAQMILQLFSALMLVGADVRHDVRDVGPDEVFFTSSMRADLVLSGVKMRVSTVLRFKNKTVPASVPDEVETHRYELASGVAGRSFDIRVGLVGERDMNRVKGHQLLRSGLEEMLGILARHDRLRYDPVSKKFGLVVDNIRRRFVPDRTLMDPSGIFIG